MASRCAVGRIALEAGELTLSRIAFGCAAMGGHDYGRVSDADSVAAVDRAIGLGITTFDVADVYGLGRAERVLGGALRGRRGEVEVATKGGVRWDYQGRTERTLEPAYLARAIDDSLVRLGRDVIDLYQLHWPVAGTAYEDVMATLLAARDAGKLRTIGVCNFSPVDVARLTAAGPVATEQLPFNLGDRESEPALRDATAAGRVTMVYNALAQGLFAGRHRVGERFDGTDLRSRYGYFRPERLATLRPVLERLHLIAARRGYTPLQVAVRWLLQHPAVGLVVAGIKHPWQAEEIAGAAGCNLTDDELRVLDGTHEPADAHA